MANREASPASASVVVDGEEIDLEAYSIGGNNYFRICDLAYVLNHSGKQFGVNWDADANTILLVSDLPYEPVGEELSKGASTKTQTVPYIFSKVYLNGDQVYLKAYFIGGNNYFRLRDIGSILDFGIRWDGETKTIYMDTTAHYSK